MTSTTTQPQGGANMPSVTTQPPGGANDLCLITTPHTGGETCPQSLPCWVHEPRIPPQGPLQALGGVHTHYPKRGKPLAGLTPVSGSPTSGMVRGRPPHPKHPIPCAGRTRMDRHPNTQRVTRPLGSRGGRQILGHGCFGI
jgi:hypothetical protein